MNLMRISVIQMEVALGKPNDNYAHAEKLVRQAANNADVVVLPEMWNTGFFPKGDLSAFSDQAGKQTRWLMKKLAKELSVNIVAGSVAIQIEKRFLNRSYIFDREGNEVAYYDKIHLFSPMGENAVFSPGHHIVYFELDKIKCGIIICYDLRFPELVRSLSLKGIDILFVVSQWPKARILQADILTQARAIENQIFLAYANSCSVAGDTVYGGHSALIDPSGTILSRAGEIETILYGSFDLSVLDNIRRTIPVHIDRRPEVYQSDFDENKVP